MRRLWFLTCAALLIGAGCSDDESKPPPVSTGAGFSGVSWVAPDRTGRLVVGWKPSAGAKQYKVYASLHEGRTLKNAPVATVPALAPDDTTPWMTVVIAPTTPNERHFITVHATDEKGLEDANTIVKSAIAAPDTTPPQFAGARAVAPLANAGATVTWDPATDDFSPPEAISYDVFAGRTAQSLVQIGRTRLGETTLALPTLGEPTEQFVFSVRARDIANNVSTDPKPITGPLGPDAVPPTFEGCGPITEVGSRSVTVQWKPATDDHSPPEELQYEVYAAFAAGGQDFTAAPLAKVKGATSLELKALDPGKAYFFVCRARDDAGNVDANKAEKTVTTLSDVIAPTFDGIDTATVDGIARTVILTWLPATDDKTEQSKIVYDVFETKTPGVYDFTAPRTTTAPAATSITLTDLEARTSLSWVVRARDESKNRDLNLKEKSGDIKTSFSLNVLPLLEQNCAVVGCHVSGIAPAGLNLAPAFAYDQLVNVTSREKAPKKRVALGTADLLGDSWIYEKINPNPSSGAQMPAPQTGNALTQLQKDIITSWILDGAARN